MTAEDASFTEHQATAAFMRCAEGLDFTPDELADLRKEVIESTRVLNPLARDGSSEDPAKVLRTSQDQLDAEHQVKMALHQTAEASFMPAAEDVVANVVAREANKLDTEQRGAFEAITSARGVSFLEGEAGTGKTTVMRPALAALRESGAVDQVVVVSVAARTARSTGRKLGADLSGPIEEVVGAVENGELKITPKTIVVVDEAFVADTRRMRDLTQAARGARYVFVGDPEQARPIGAAGPRQSPEWGP